MTGTGKILEVLIIEDDPYFRAFLAKTVSPFGHVHQVDNFQDGMEYLEAHSYDVAIIDLNLRGRNVGLKLLETAKAKNVFSIILTDNHSPAVIKKAYEVGCNHYLSKDQCEAVLGLILRERRNEIGNDPIHTFLKKQFVTQDMQLLNEIKSLKGRLSTDRPIMLLGETGVGKGQIAELVHRIYGGQEENFVAVNVAAIPEHLLESELFGHVKGAFTGANGRKKGKLELANHGTLFLDELGSMPLTLQVKVLKALEEKVFWPLGSEKSVKSNFRIISATCDDIYRKIKEGKFRLDLFHRLNSITIHLSPLRERRGDIPLLVEFFLKRKTRKVHITNEAMGFLVDYRWSGNVRELKSIIDDLVEKNDGIIRKRDLPSHIVHNEAPFLEFQGGHFLPEEHVQYFQTHGLRRYLDRIENEVFRYVCASSKGSNTKAMEVLQLPVPTYYRLLKKVEAEKTY